MFVRRALCDEAGRLEDTGVSIAVSHSMCWWGRNCVKHYSINQSRVQCTPKFLSLALVKGGFFTVGLSDFLCFAFLFWFLLLPRDAL